jgi:hypothetical protein
MVVFARSQASASGADRVEEGESQGGFADAGIARNEAEGTGAFGDLPVELQQVFNFGFASVEPVLEDELSGEVVSAEGEGGGILEALAGFVEVVQEAGRGGVAMLRVFGEQFEEDVGEDGGKTSLDNGCGGMASWQCTSSRGSSAVKGGEPAAHS